MVVWLFNAAILMLSYFALLTPIPSNAAQSNKINETSHTVYSVQVGAWSKEINAEDMVSRLKQKGINAYYFKRDNGIFAVRFGDFPTRNAASEAARKLVADKVIDAYFIASPVDVGSEKEQATVHKQQADKYIPKDKMQKAEHEVDKLMHDIERICQTSVKNKLGIIDSINWSSTDSRWDIDWNDGQWLNSNTFEYRTGHAKVEAVYSCHVDASKYQKFQKLRVTKLDIKNY